ncbi:unnamed protein product, partial [Lampetra fluviatilis]
ELVQQEVARLLGLDPRVGGEGRTDSPLRVPRLRRRHRDRVDLILRQQQQAAASPTRDRADDVAAVRPVAAPQTNELQQEERGWVDYRAEERRVKLQLADGVLDALLADTAALLGTLATARRRRTPRAADGASAPRRVNTLPRAALRRDCPVDPADPTRHAALSVVLKPPTFKLSGDPRQTLYPAVRHELRGRDADGAGRLLHAPPRQVSPCALDAPRASTARFLLRGGGPSLAPALSPLCGVRRETHRHLLLARRKLFCRDDFFSSAETRGETRGDVRFGTRCCGCSEGIAPGESVRRARERLYHARCFACCACARRLVTGIGSCCCQTRASSAWLTCPRLLLNNNSNYNNNYNYNNYNNKMLTTGRREAPRSVNTRRPAVWFQNRRAKEKRIKKDVGRERWGPSVAAPGSGRAGRGRSRTPRPHQEANPGKAVHRDPPPPDCSHHLGGLAQLPSEVVLYGGATGPPASRSPWFEMDTGIALY